MGVLNITPDSFSDGGSYLDVGRALARAEEMVAEGAVVIDVGGESTRPGAEPVSLAEELRRVEPVVEAVTTALDVIVSVDTRNPEVMQAALAAGAHMINDVTALRAPGAVAVVAESGAAVCLIHLQGEPATMQDRPDYSDVVGEVKQFLRQRIETVIRAGIAGDRILVDPGFGFGKSVQHNLILLKNLGEFLELGCPLLVGLSRKSMIGALLDLPPTRRLYGSLSAAVVAVMGGARLVRTHDVAPTVQALRVAEAVLET